MKKTKVNTTDAPQSAAQISGDPNPRTATEAGLDVEATAKAAYARLAEELKWKGDFPEWDAVSERARALYVSSVTHIQDGKPTRTRFEEIVAEGLR